MKSFLLLSMVFVLCFAGCGQGVGEAPPPQQPGATMPGKTGGGNQMPPVSINDPSM